MIGSGWSGTGTHLEGNDSFYVLTSTIPHNLFLPHCAAAIHHGGCGTTHSMTRAGIPQIVVPIFVDQHYWGYRVTTLGLGPARAKLGKIKRAELHRRIKDLMTNPAYKQNAADTGAKLRAEHGPQALCDYIERNYPQTVGEKQEERHAY